MRKLEERWIIVPVQALALTQVVDIGGNRMLTADTPRGPLILMGLHPKTKMLLHTYGPFGSVLELEGFAATHNITLPKV